MHSRAIADQAKTLSDEEGDEDRVAVADATPDPAPEVPFESLHEVADDFFDNVLATESDGEDDPLQGDTAGDVDLAPALEGLGDDEAKEMFGNIAAGYVRPVRQFHARLTVGPVAAQWLEVCLPAVEMVARSAHSMGLQSLAPSVNRLASVLNTARERGASEIQGTVRNDILQAYSELSGILPQAFALAEDLLEKDGIVVHSVLGQVADVGRVTLDKVFGAGLTSIEMFEGANAKDLAATTGIPSYLAARICEAVQEYRRESQALQAYSSPSQWLRLFRRVVAELEESHESFQRYAAVNGGGPEEARDRRRHRRARQVVMLKIHVLLAEMGEVDFVDEIRKVSFDRAIEKLGEFMTGLGEWADGKGLEERSQEFPTGVAEHG